MSLISDNVPVVHNFCVGDSVHHVGISRYLGFAGHSFSGPDFDLFLTPAGYLFDPIDPVVLSEPFRQLFAPLIFSFITSFDLAPTLTLPGPCTPSSFAKYVKYREVMHG